MHLRIVSKLELDIICYFYYATEEKMQDYRKIADRLLAKLSPEEVELLIKWMEKYKNLHEVELLLHENIELKKELAGLREQIEWFRAQLQTRMTMDQATFPTADYFGKNLVNDFTDQYFFSDEKRAHKDASSNQYLIPRMFWAIAWRVAILGMLGLAAVGPNPVRVPSAALAFPVMLVLLFIGFLSGLLFSPDAPAGLIRTFMYGTTIYGILGLKALSYRFDLVLGVILVIFAVVDAIYCTLSRSE